MSRFRDFLGPKGDTIQIILKKKGKPVTEIRVGDKGDGIQAPKPLQEKTNDHSRKD